MALLSPHLVLVELTVLEFLFSFFLERYNHKTDKDVDHEERNNDDVDDVEHCN